MTTNTNADPLDAAYLAIGAARELDKQGAHRLLGSELDIIEDATSLAPLLQTLWEEQGDDWAGVWAYDVAEPLGAWSARTFNTVRGRGAAEAYARDLIRVVSELSN